jgi:hypothetical protein
MLGADESAWQQRIFDELDNLRAATLWSIDTPDAHDAALRIVAALASETTMGRTTGIGSWAEQILPLADEATPGKRAAILGAAAWHAIDGGDYARARELASPGRAGGLTPDCGAPSLVHGALAFATVVEGGGNAMEICEELLRTLEERGGDIDVDLASMHSMMSMCRLLAAEPLEQIEREAEAGLAAAMRSGSATMQSVVHSTLGNAYLMHGDPHRAMFHLETSISLVENGAGDVMYSSSLRSAARAAGALADVTAGATFASASLVHANRTGDRRSAYEALDEACIVLTNAGHAHAAVELGAHCKALGFAFSAFGVERDRSLARARAALTDDQRDVALALGSALSYDDAVAFTLAALDQVVTGTQ